MVIPCRPEFRPYQVQFARGLQLIDLAKEHHMMDEYALITSLFHDRMNTLVGMERRSICQISLHTYTLCLDLFEEAMNDALPRAK